MPDTARRKAPLWLETIILLVIAVALALVLKTFFVQAFYIPSSSMKPGLVVNDRILVEKPSYWFGGEPERGDVVVFEDPGGWLPGRDPGPTNAVTRAMAAIGLYPTGGHLVKRVIGKAGDTIVCCDEEGRLEINGYAIDEDEFIAPQKKCDGPMPTRCREDWSVGPIPEGDLFVMGDNRVGVRGLLATAVPGVPAGVRPRGGVRPCRPRRRQGVRPRVADQAPRLDRPTGRLRRRTRPELSPAGPPARPDPPPGRRAP